MLALPLCEVTNSSISLFLLFFSLFAPQEFPLLLVNVMLINLKVAFPLRRHLDRANRMFYTLKRDEVS